MTTAKSEVLIGLLLKNCHLVGAMNLWPGESAGPNFGSSGGLPSVTQVGKTFSSAFILKIILPRVGIQMLSLEVYKLQIFYAQRVSYVQRWSFWHIKSYTLDFVFQYVWLKYQKSASPCNMVHQSHKENLYYSFGGCHLHWVNISMFLALILI